jgi:hypothetical protein
MEFTQEEKSLLKESIDVTISTIGNSINQVEPQKRNQIRLLMSRYINLSDKVDSLPEPKTLKTEK